MITLVTPGLLRKPAFTVGLGRRGHDQRRDSDGQVDQEHRPPAQTEEAAFDEEASQDRADDLRSGAHIQERADEFFGPLAHRLDTTMSHYPPQLLEQIESFMADLRSAMDAHLTEQGQATPRSPRTPGGRTA
ncbi:hypothetical protein ABZY57_15150 [Streptomyces sp. NPDC006450]|uniref:hypothetical protein n=1 Tax=Streptomyces sp. NPDC006450 TaxID=3155458 RepID=UPI00339FDB96